MPRHFARLGVGCGSWRNIRPPARHSPVDLAAEPGGRRGIVIARDPDETAPAVIAASMARASAPSRSAASASWKESPRAMMRAGLAAPPHAPCAAGWRGCRKAAGTGGPGHRNCLFRNAGRRKSGCACAGHQAAPQVSSCSVSPFTQIDQDHSTRIASAISASSFSRNISSSTSPRATISREISSSAGTASGDTRSSLPRHNSASDPRQHIAQPGDVEQAGAGIGIGGAQQHMVGLMRPQHVIDQVGGKCHLPPAFFLAGKACARSARR